MRHILSVDPGKATGLSYFTFDAQNDPEMLWSKEVQQHEYADPIRKAFAYSQSQGVKLEVVCERFTINAQTVRNSQAPFSLEQIGILKQIMLDNGRMPRRDYFSVSSRRKSHV